MEGIHADVQLNTARLRLRAPQVADVPQVQALAAEREVAMMLATMPHPYPEGAALEWLQRSQEAIAKQEGLPLSILRRSDGKFMGTVGIWPNWTHMRAELGYWVGKPHWGQGYAPEAVQAVIDFGFSELGLNRIYATYFVENGASRRVMDKAGMTFEGIHRQHYMKWGEPKDAGMCAILRSEWLAKQRAAP